MRYEILDMRFIECLKQKAKSKKVILSNPEYIVDVSHLTSHISHLK